MPPKVQTKAATVAKKNATEKKNTPPKKEKKVEENVETPSETVVTPGGTRTRREVNVETVDAEFTALCELLQSEISTNGSKFLRSVNKRLGVLQKDVRRVTKQKRKNAGVASPNSGFLKTSKISNELADFLGLERGAELSRVDATKNLHQYIIQNNLQNPDNRREIVPNKALSKLLGYKQKDCVDTDLNKNGVAKNPDGKLYYYVMQKLIQKHFQ